MVVSKLNFQSLEAFIQCCCNIVTSGEFVMDGLIISGDCRLDFGSQTRIEELFS